MISKTIEDISGIHEEVLEDESTGAVRSCPDPLHYTLTVVEGHGKRAFDFLCSSSSS